MTLEPHEVEKLREIVEADAQELERLRRFLTEHRNAQIVVYWQPFDPR